MRQTILATMAILGMASMASAAVLSVGDYSANPGDQVVVTITATGGETADGINLFLLVGNGGPTVGGSDQTAIGAPIITGGSSLWATAPNQFFNDIGAGPEKWAAGNILAIPTGSATVQGQLATFTLQVPGNASGSYALSLERGNTSVFMGITEIPSQLVNGTLTVIPEPAAALLLGLGGLFLRRRSA